MPIRDNAELKSLMNSIVTEMLDFMTDEDVSYTKVDVEECQNLLESYSDNASQAKDKEVFLDCVKTAVLQLNTLNKAVGYDLIETDQREDICEYIIRVSALLGYDNDEDITEEWREW